MARIWIDTSGSWSGGGAVVLRNLRVAATKRPDLLSFMDGPGRVRLIPRNFPVSRHRLGLPFLLMPQNAWAWHGTGLVLDEIPRRTILATASRVAMSRSGGVLRIASTIPSKSESSDGNLRVIPNVLDEQFETALVRAKDLELHLPSRDYFFCMGACYSYRNLIRLVKGYSLYRAQGGRTSLVLSTAPGSPHCFRTLREHARSTVGIMMIPTVDRPAALRAMMGAEGVIAPALVEASPVTVLEALAITPRVALSDIPGHREILGNDTSNGPIFPATDVGAIADAFRRLDQGHGFFHQHRYAMERQARLEARERWTEDVCRQLETLV